MLVHARTLLTSTPEGATDYLDADVRDVDKILAGAAQTLDFTQPIGLMLLGILGNVPDDDEAHAVLKAYVDALPAGSYVAINDGTKQTTEHEQAEQVAHDAGHQYKVRTPTGVAAFFNVPELELVEPGVVSTPMWRPQPDEDHTPLAVHCGVARKL